MKISNKKQLFILFFTLFLLIITQNDRIYPHLEHNYYSQKILKTSDYWELTYLWIDETGYNGITWAEAKLEPWCSGEGTETEPYIIENVFFNGSQITLSNVVEIYSSSAYFIIKNCTLTTNGKNKRGIFLNRASNGLVINNSFVDIGNDAIEVYYSANHSIKRNNFHFNAHAISSVNSYNINILDNVIMNNSVGITLINGNHNSVINNIIKGVNNGISFFWEHHSNVINNTVEKNLGMGLYLEELSYSLITNNIIINNKLNGIYLEGSSYNEIISNKIINNSQDGVKIYAGSTYNIFRENFIRNNTQYGVYLQRYSVQTGYCENNLFYNNSFINNGEHALDEGVGPYSYSPLNYWNNTNIGNYWDDYNGTDSNDDGIGDTPYDVPETASRDKDYLPIWFDGPTLQINLPYENQLFGDDPPEFNVETHDPHFDTFWYTIDENETKYIIYNNGTIENNAWIFLEDGPVILKFLANDTFGNINSNEVTVIKDTFAPTITINSPTPNQLCGIIAPTFNLQIIEPNLQETRYSLNGRPNITFTTETQFSQTEWNQVGNGTVSIIFYAIDKVGNTNSSEVIVRKDAYIPDITIFSPLDNERFGKTSPEYNISIIEEDLASTWYTIEGIAGTFPFTGLTGTINQDAWDDAPEGEITITFYAIDGAGNTGSESVVVIKSIPSKPEAIPGYNLFLLFGILVVISIVISKKGKKG